MFGKFLKTILGLLLIPVAIGFAKSFYFSLSGISIFSSTLHVLERGVLAYLLIHVLLFRPAYIYVLGHEIVHVIATWICGGHVVSFSVTPSGGNVVTSKTNFFIELSPYFVPLYTILLGVAYVLMKTIGYTIPHMTPVFIFMIGITVTFHFVMTADVLKMQQSDIARSGLIFSLIIILVSNLLVVMAVFCPLFKLSFIEFVKRSGTYSGEMYQAAYISVSEFVKVNKFW